LGWSFVIRCIGLVLLLAGPAAAQAWTAYSPEGGRYRIDAHSDAGTDRVRGLTVADDASFTVQALSGSGDVSVESAP